MKKYLLTTTCLLALTGVASAADLPVKAAPYAPIPVVNWTGGYIGGHIGVARLNTFGTQILPSYGFYGACTQYYGQASCATSDTGIAGGVEIGYDWQNGRFVYGVAADWTWTDLDHSTTNYSGSATFRAKVDWLASFRGRMGLAVDDTMVYITGGLALGHLKSSNFWGGTDCTPSCTGDYGSLSKTKVGWVAGLGVEHKFSRNWSVKAELLYYDLGHETGSNTQNGYTYATDYSHEIFVGRVGVNYRF